MTRAGRALDWRLSALAGATLGVGASPLLPVLDPGVLAVALAAWAVLSALRPGGATAAAGVDAAADGPVSLGSATVEDLDAIEGIGPVTAQNIIDYRDEHGGLSSIEELDEVSGIGPVTMDTLRDGLQP